MAVNKCPGCEAELSPEDTSTFACPQCGSSLSSLFDATEVLDQTMELWEQTLAQNVEAHHSLQVDHSLTEMISDPPTLRPFSVGAATEAPEIPQDFELMDLLGEGGMGLVYQARQNSLGRSIALKMIKPEHAGSQQARDLFLAEAMVTSQLDHPNIVPIHELGTNDTDQLFYSMKEVKGSPWSSRSSEMSLAENLAILIRMADGVAFAHVHGVVHRDLKPTNVMLGDFGEILLMDWGLAVRCDPETGRAALNQRTALAGTPVYMAPEMARGEYKKIGPSSDLYLLGAILFQLITGKPPHLATNAHACIMMAAKNVIIETDVKGELMDIAMKAMATRISDRFPDVKAFQEALRTYQSHYDSILISERAAQEFTQVQASKDYNQFARCVFGFQEALSSWDGNPAAREGLHQAVDAYARCALDRDDLDLAASLVEAEGEKHPELLGEIKHAVRVRNQRRSRLNLMRRTATALALTIFTILAVAFFWIRKERDRSLLAEEQTRQALYKAERQNYFNLIALAGRKIEDHQFDQARSLLADTPIKLRGWEWGHLEVLCHEDLRTILPDAGAMRALGFAPDGLSYAHGSEQGMVSIREVVDDTVLHAFDLHNSRINDLAYSPDGVYLASASNDKTIRVWDVASGLETLQLDGRDYVNAVAFHPDSRQLASGSSDKVIRLWELGSRQTIHELEGHTDWVRDLDYASSGKFLLSGSRDGTARWWDLETHEVVFVLPSPGGEITSVAVAPNGRMGLTGSEDGSVQIWNLNDGSLLLSWQAHAGGVSVVGWHPHKPWMLSAGADHVVRQWIAPGEAASRSLVGHRDAVLSLACSKDGSRILTGGADEQIKLWDAAQSRSSRVLTGHEDHVNAIAFSPDGRWIASGSWDGSVRLWDAETSETIQTLEGHEDLVRSVSFSPDSRRLLTASWDFTVRVWDVESAKQLHSFEQHEDLVHAAAFNHQGTHFLTASSDTSAAYCMADSGKEVFRLNGHTNWVTAVAISPDDRLAATAGRDARTVIWDLETGIQVKRLDGHTAWVSSVAFSPDGQQLLTASQDQSARLWDIESGQVIHELGGHGDKVHVGVFNPDGKRLLTGGDDATARLWDVETGKELLVLRGYKGGIYAAAFHPDGQSVGVAGLDNVAVIWTASPWHD